MTEEQPTSFPSVQTSPSDTPWVTYTQIAVLTVIFFIEQKIGLYPQAGWLTPSLQTLQSMGGLDTWDVFTKGQWYRILAGSLLHANFAHLVGNLVALYFAGTHLEQQIGKNWVLALCFLGALGGATMSLLFNSAQVISVGYSGVIMAQLAAAYVLSFRLPEGSVRTKMQVRLLVFLIPTVLPMLGFVNGRNTDLSCHLGGMIVGFAFGFWLKPKPPFSPILDMSAKILGRVGVSAFILAMVVDIFHLQLDVGRATEANLAKAAAADKPKPPPVPKSGTVSLAGFTVHLPPGEWELVTKAGAHSETSKGEFYVLAQMTDNHLNRAIILRAQKSTGSPGAGFDLYKICSEQYSNINYVNTSEGMKDHDHQACWMIYDLFSPEVIKEAMVDYSQRSDISFAFRDLISKNIQVFQDYMSVFYYRAEKWGELEAIYLNSPEAENISSSRASSQLESDWSSINIWKFPEKRVYVERLKDSAGKNWASFKEDFLSGDPSGSPMAGQPIQQAAMPQLPQKTGAGELAINRGARSGAKQLIDAFHSTNPDCTNMGYPSVSVSVPPSHGTVEVEHGDLFPNFPKDNPRSACNSQKVEAVKVFYTSNPDFSGQDSVETSTVFASGALQKHRITIEVQKP